MSHIPSSAMPHPHVHDDKQHSQPAARSHEPEHPADTKAESASPSTPAKPEAPEPSVTAGGAFKAGAWLALGAGLTAAAVAVARRARTEPHDEKPKRRHKRKGG